MCSGPSYCDREAKACVDPPPECPTLPAPSPSGGCLCAAALERCQEDCRTEARIRPEAVALSGEVEPATNCIDHDLTTNCNSTDTDEYPYLVLTFAEPLTVKQVLVWHNKNTPHRAQNLRVFVFADESEVKPGVLIDAEDMLLGEYQGPPHDGEDYLTFGDQCSPGIEGSVVVIQRDSLGWGINCPECLSLDLMEVLVKHNVTQKFDASCSSVSTIAPITTTTSSDNTGTGDYSFKVNGINPWVLFEFDQTIEVKQVGSW